MIDFNFDWKDVKGTRFYVNDAEPLDCFFLVWVDENDELLNVWMIQKIYT